MFSFFKRKNSKKQNSGVSNVQNNNETSVPERDERISMVQCYQEKSKSADHNIQQVPSNKCSRNINPSLINDREQKTSPLDGIIEDKNKTIHCEQIERNSLSLKSDVNNIESSVVKHNQSNIKTGENGNTTSCQKDGDIGQEIKCDYKNKQEEKSHEFSEKIINGVQNLPHEESVQLFRDQYTNKDVKAGKEVINLLLPEKSNKKSDSLSKTAVQNLFDIMGGGRKRKNKNNKFKSPELSNRKSWSFNNNKIKTDLISTNDHDDSPTCENILPRKLDLQRSSSVPNANIDEKLVSQNTKGLTEQCAESMCNTFSDSQHMSMSIDRAANKSLESSERERTESTSAINSTCQNKNKRQTLEETPAAQHNDNTKGEKERGTMSDDSREDVTSDSIGNCAKTVGSQPERCENLVLSNSSSPKCDTGQTCHDDSADIVKSLLLDKYKNNKIHNKHKAENDLKPVPLNGVLNDQNIGIGGDIYKPRDNHNPAVETKHTSGNSDSLINMGAGNSRQGGGQAGGDRVDKSLLKDENIAGKSDYVVTECGRAQGEAVNVTQGEKTVVITSQLDVNALNEANIQKNIRSESSNNNCDIVRENDNRENCRVEMEDVDNCTEELLSNESNGKRLKNILKETVDCEGKSAVKKHVTFHKIIHFDDGDNVEDDDSISFASLENEDEENGEFDLNNVENYEVVFPENDESCESGDSKTNDQTVNSKESHSDIEKDISKKCKNNVDLFDEFVKSRSNKDVEIQELSDDVENNENLGLEESDDKLSKAEDDSVEDVNNAFNKIIQVKEPSESESEEEEEAEESESDDEEVETCEESNSEDESESGECSSASDEIKKEKAIFDSEKVIEEVRKQEAVWEVEEKEENSAYADLLRVVERQLMRGLAGQEGRLADLQERAAALHRVQSEVCSARKEAELVRQKLKHVEGDLTATRTRNCQLLEQLEARAEEIRLAERKADELAEEVVRLQQKLDQIEPAYNELKNITDKLKKDTNAAHFEELAKERTLREQREKSWKIEFEKLRSQGAEREELLLADCEWKLRDVQKSASERCAKAEGKLAALQKAADEKSAEAEKQITDLRIEMSSLRSNSLEQQRALRQSTQQTSALETAKNTLEQESKRLKTLLNMEMDKSQVLKTQHAKELDEKDRRMMIRLAEEAKKAEMQGRLSRRTEECTLHDKALREANKKIQELKEMLTKKESQYSDRLEKAEARADWQILEIRRSLDKAELKYSEAVEKLEDKYVEDTERITLESEKRTRDLEGALSAQTCSSRATLELVRERLQGEHTDNMLKLKDEHRREMENQWELFTKDKEQCLERMKLECMMEGEEEREKRDKQLLKDLDELKQELESKEHSVGSLRTENKKAIEARTSAERRLNEAQAAFVAREIAVRSEAARQAEVEKKEARDTIEHLTKKCTCLSNLFEDMRSRWQQAPGEAAQLRKALQDEKARAQALRRQLDALSRELGVTVRTGQDEGGQNSEGAHDHAEDTGAACAVVKKFIVEKDGGIRTVIKTSDRKKKSDCKNEHGSEVDESIKVDKCDVNKKIFNKGNSNIAQNDDKTDEKTNNSNEFGNMWSLMKKGGFRKRGRRSVLSPPRQPVELPAVTVPVRIRQFDPNRKKKI